MQLFETHPNPATQASPSLVAHVPAALQVLVPEQAVPVMSSALVTATLQVPLDPQFQHCGQLATPQHTPSRQVLPDWHSAVAEHAAPAAFFAWQAPPAVQ